MSGLLFAIFFIASSPILASVLGALILGAIAFAVLNAQSKKRAIRETQEKFMKQVKEEENHPMKTNRYMPLISMFAFACLALPADAADRMRAGQWVGTTTAAGRTFNTSNCMAQSDVDAMNGDVESVRAYLEKVIPPAICKLTDIQVNGGQVIYTSACRAGAATVVTTVTTAYHGDSFESADTKGTKSEAKLVGACK
jgi:hypothetical protein